MVEKKHLMTAVNIYFQLHSLLHGDLPWGDSRFFVIWSLVEIPEKFQYH